MSSVNDTIDIENVVASTDIGQELALDSLAIDLSGSDYNPDNKYSKRDSYDTRVFTSSPQGRT